ncbi:MAG TPA: hypothetical protein PKZ84_11585 [Anaerolineae bacterium]|nr:hypothetical protein [Anaerolineae bacterium]
MTEMTKDLCIEQFTYGKIIDSSGRDVYGFTIVARSPGVPANDQLLYRIRALATVGQTENLGAYIGSDAAFAVDDYVVMARFQRSPRPYGRGYFLQEHYLLTSRNAFATLSNNYTYLQALLPAEIPWHTEYRRLPTLALPQRVLDQERARAELTLQGQAGQIFHALQLVLDGQQPFVIESSALEHESLLRFLETLALLLPPGGRAGLSWATNVLNVQQCKARVKVISGNAVGTENHTVIRLGSAHSSQSLLAGSESARGYITRLRGHLNTAGVSTALKTVETITLPPEMPWEQYAAYLKEHLWYRIGPTTIRADLPSLPRPLSQIFYDNTLVPMLDQVEYQLSVEERTVFLQEIIKGIVEGVIPPEYASRVPRDAGKISAEMFWPGLEHLFTPERIIQDGPTRGILRVWQRDKNFWEQPQVEDWVYRLLHQGLSTLSTQSDQAAAYLREIAALRLIPRGAAYQAGLLKGAMAKGMSPQHLLLAWVDMTTELDVALEVAHQVPKLAELIEDSGTYTYISMGLKGEKAEKIDDLMTLQPPANLDADAELLLALALLGERLHVPGFRCAQILFTIRRQIQRLAPEQVNDLIECLYSQSAMLDRKTVTALGLLMLSAGQVDRFKRYLLGNWQWIDTLLSWLKEQRSLTPASRAAVNLGIEWIKTPVQNVSFAEQKQRLRELFEHWVALTAGTPEAINELTVLLLQHAFKGENGEQATRGSLIQFGGTKRDVVAQTVNDIQWINTRLFPRGRQSVEQEKAYRDALDAAYRAAWVHHEFTSNLTRALKNAGLKFEAGRINYLRMQQYGPEIFPAMLVTLEKIAHLQTELLEVLEDVEDITPEQINALVNPALRAQLRQRGHEVSQQSLKLGQAIAKFRDVLPRG